MSIFLFNRGQNKNPLPNRFIKHSFFVDVCTKFVPYVRVFGRPHGGDGCRWQPLIADRSGSVDRPYNICTKHNVWCRGRRPRRPFAFPSKGKASHSARSPPHFNLLFRRFGRGLCYREHVLSAKRSESCALPKIGFQTSVCVFHCEFRQGNLKLSIISCCRLVVKVC